MTTATTKQQFTTLYHTGKTGKIVEWNIWTEGSDIVTEWGQIDGKKQITQKTAIGKNVGRSNETSDSEQAILEAAAMHKKKLDMKYSETMHEAKKEVFLPMLASSFDKRKDKVTYPVDVQPKLDGVRCMAFWNGDHIELMSRGGKKWECCDHIIEQLELALPKGWVLDGELYIHGATFQEITRLVKKLRPESVNVEYHVYDIPRVKNGRPCEWIDRKACLHELYEMLYENKCTGIIPVDSFLAENEADVYMWQSLFLEDGYEGAIVREFDGEYRMGHRSNKLLKIKNFMDDEFEIIGFTTGVGRFNGCIIWECITDGGDEFRVVPQGTEEERRTTYTEAEDHIGEMLKVKFFDLTDDGIPRFPVGIGIRLEKDM
jgi:DNA ligase 1